MELYLIGNNYFGMAADSSKVKSDFAFINEVMLRIDIRLDHHSRVMDDINVIKLYESIFIYAAEKP